MPTKSNTPRKLEFGMTVEGVSYPVLCYNEPPKEVRKAKTTELKLGWPVLYKVELGPDTGKYYSDIITKNNYRAFIQRINSGGEVYVGDIPLYPNPAETNE